MNVMWLHTQWNDTHPKRGRRASEMAQRTKDLTTKPSYLRWLSLIPRTHTVELGN